MVNKRVPDWLNSSMWQSPPPPATTTAAPPPPPPPIKPPSPPPYEDRSSKPDSVSSSDGSGNEAREAREPARPEVAEKTGPVQKTEGSEYDVDPVEDVSRQVQLSQELSKKIINMGELQRLASLGIPDSAGIRSTVWKDTEIIEQIDRDVKRTHPDMHFFSGDSASAKANQDALKNILIIYAKLNPGIRYVQGMNEILAPLYYVFKNDPNEDFVVNAEADTFFCFVELLSGIRDNFCKQLDNSVVGIRSTISRMSQLLKEHDEELWRHLELTTKVNPQFYAFRWITLLLTQEFNFADILHIWDTLLSDPEGPQETLLRVCCAMLILVRRRLLAGDFTANLKLLQSYPSTNIGHLLYVANKLRSHSHS